MFLSVEYRADEEKLYTMYLYWEEETMYVPYLAKQAFEMFDFFPPVKSHLMLTGQSEFVNFNTYGIKYGDLIIIPQHGYYFDMRELELYKSQSEQVAKFYDWIQMYYTAVRDIRNIKEKREIQ
jgi:hypothetical protein